jgi:peptidoglycan hydrolase-like protein with peptidoglycan-binding domain
MSIVSQAFVAAELQVDRVYAKGDKGKKVTTIQQWLSLNGENVMIDGVYGAATEAAVKSFQDERNLPITGSVDQKTMDQLVAPMTAVLKDIPVNGRTLPQMILAYADQHLKQHPREIGGQNMGPWVRLYMKGKEGKDWPWCAGFVSTIVAQAAKSCGKTMPFTPTFSCDVLAMEARKKSILFNDKQINTPAAPAAALAGSVFVRKRTPADWDHTGLVIQVNADHMVTIEGNTNDAGDREGYEVCKRRRDLKGKDFIRLDV